MEASIEDVYDKDDTEEALGVVRRWASANEGDPEIRAEVVVRCARVRAACENARLRGLARRTRLAAEREDDL